ncbi:MAG: hypothetical protein ACXV74_00475 [Methylobacter sp.]
MDKFLVIICSAAAGVLFVSGSGLFEPFCFITDIQLPSEKHISFSVILLIVSLMIKFAWVSGI